MFRDTLHVTTSTDVEATVSHLRAKSADAGIDPTIVDLISNQTRDLLSTLVEQGRRIAAVGSQMEATRELRGDGYSIRLVFREGVRRTFVQRLIDMVRGA